MAVSKLVRSTINSPTSPTPPRGPPRFTRRYRGRQLPRQILLIIVPASAIFIFAIAITQSLTNPFAGIPHLYSHVPSSSHFHRAEAMKHIDGHSADQHQLNDVQHDKGDQHQSEHTSLSSSQRKEPETQSQFQSDHQKQQEQQEESSDVTSEKFPDVSAVILFHSEYPTLNHTLQTWEKNGMHTLIKDFVFFLNGIETRDEFDRLLPHLRDPAWEGKVRVVPSKTNLPLGLAIRQMVQLANHEYVLLLEKDWALIEPLDEVRYQLSASVSMIKSGKAHLARFRHRKRPGAPLYAQITYQGRENRILQRQTNLFCYMHHWIDDLSQRYDQYFTNCTPKNSKYPFWCSKARFCNWTNNPGIFSRTWFLEQLGDPFEHDYNETVTKDPNSHMLDFEFYTNWKNEIWNDRDYIIALPLGLFEHKEVDEQNLMNTVWHAWSRLSTDKDEKQGEYVLTERKVCSTSNKSHSAGVKYSKVFPLDFVHLYHYDRAMERTVTEAVEELHTEAIKQRDSLRDGHGTWRNGITELTNLWYKTVLYTYPLEPSQMKLGFVTAAYAFDGRSTTQSKTVAQVVTNLYVLRHYRAIVYTDSETKRLISDALRNEQKWSDQDLAGVQFVEQDLRGMLERVLTPRMMERVVEARNSDNWKKRITQRLNDSAASQGSGDQTVVLPSENESAFSLAAPLLLRDAEQRSSGRSAFADSGWDESLRELTHLVWFDAISPCVLMSSTGLWSDNGRDANVNDYVFRGNMLLNSLVTGRRVETMEAMDAMLGASGFDPEVFMTETETKFISQGLRIIDGRTMGGSRLAITLLAGYYDSVLTDMVIKRRLLGTLREPLTIAHKNVDYNFQFFDAFERCPDGEDCGPVATLTNRSVASVDSTSGCRLYQWSSKCAV